MKKIQKNFETSLKKYVLFLKKHKLYQSKKKFFYENNIEKMSNWTNANFSKTLGWYNKIRISTKATVKTVHLEKMKKWIYDKKKGVIKHTSGEFFHIEGKRILKSEREVKSWDQPFIKQVDYKGGIIGLVRSNINGVPHYLVDAKYEPGNYNKIQISPSLQATYSNLNRIHMGEKNKVVKKYFSKNYKTIRKFWVTEDGGRLFLKRNLHWIIQYNGKINLPGKTFRWLTLWELDKFIKVGSVVGPHLRSILSLI
jgi:dTDP-4-dehydro-6-deoxy-alpha-D-glucopyranose 2,3-dehydratase